MEHLQPYLQSLQTIVQRDQRYPLPAYACLLAALNATISALEKPRHISGQELSEGFRRYALDQFGPLTLSVLESWNLHTTEDVGTIVFNLIEVGLLNKTADDRLEDFSHVYSFQEAFGGPYRYISEA